MTSFKDNLYTGNMALTSATSSLSPVRLTKTFNFSGNGTATAVTRSAVFPPNTENIQTTLYVTNAGSANVSNKITVSAGGNNITVIDQFGSALGIGSASLAAFGRFTPIVSAMAAPTAPAVVTNNGEIPFSVTFLPVTDDTTGTYQLHISFNRADTNWTTTGPYAPATNV